MIIALFFATGTLLGGTDRAGLFGRLIDTGSRRMSFTAICWPRPCWWQPSWSHFFGVKAEGASLEEIAEPLSAVNDAAGESAAAQPA